MKCIFRNIFIFLTFPLTIFTLELLTRYFSYFYNYYNSTPSTTITITTTAGTFTNVTDTSLTTTTSSKIKHNEILMQHYVIFICFKKEKLVQLLFISAIYVEKTI